MLGLKDQAERIFEQLQRSLKRLELELEYNYEIHICQIKQYQDSVALIAELEQLIMNQDEQSMELKLQQTQHLQQNEINFEESLDQSGFDEKDHKLLMTQLKDNINLVNDYKSQIQEVEFKRQNQLINKLVRQQEPHQENDLEQSFTRKKLRNYERVKEIENKIREKQNHLYRMQKKMKSQKDYDIKLLNQIEKLDVEIEKITNQIRYLIE